MQYTRIPETAVFDLRLTGTNDAGNACEVLVKHRGDTRYAEFILDGEVVYRRQYSGRNLAKLEIELQELRDGLHGLHEAAA